MLRASLFVKKSNPVRFQPPMEKLEERRLLAATPAVVTATLGADGTLVVTGTRRADDIGARLAASGSDQLSVSSHEVSIATFPLASVTAIRISGGGGNDLLTFVPGLTIPVTIFGDAGNDKIFGGGGDDSLNGGPGKDTLTGDAGNDVLRGDNGNDSLSGNTGDDNLDGGNGNDDCVGHEGNDVITGGNGRDTLRGVSGDDDIDGGAGNDEITGDDGNDRLRGGTGKDDINGYGGDDDINGDSGRDHIFGGDGRDDFDDNPSDRDRIEDRGADDNPGGDDAVITSTDVPAAVTNAFNSSFPNVTVREIERETEDVGVVYKFDFIDTTGLRGRARFTEAGTLLSGADHAGSGGDDAPGDDHGGGGGGGNDDGPGHT
jgi:Ca2+-binding RTX toxin-like protein